MNTTTLTKLEGSILHLLKSLNLELFELKFCRQGAQYLLRILVDRPEGGISIEECAQLNERIGRMLDRQELIKESYTLEVSSPGVNRPLKELKDFRRVVGRKVRLVSRIPLEGRDAFEGILKDISDDEIILNVESKDMHIAIDNILRAKQVI